MLSYTAVPGLATSSHISPKQADKDNPHLAILQNQRASDSQSRPTFDQDVSVDENRSDPLNGVGSEVIHITLDELETSSLKTAVTPKRLIHVSREDWGSTV